MDMTVEESPLETTPYYLDNFIWIIDFIYRKSEFQSLFIAEKEKCSLKIVCDFLALDRLEQRLYVRLLLRKHRWLTRNQIDYSNEFGGVDCVDQLLDSLLKSGFLIGNKAGMDADELFALLSLTQLKELAKQFKVTPGASQQKADIIRLLKKKYSTQKPAFGPPLRDVMARKAASLLGKMFLVEEEKRRVFNRALGLVQLSTGMGGNAVGQNPIFGLLQLNLGRLTFPPCTVRVSIDLFCSVVELDQFEEVRAVLDEMSERSAQRKYAAVKEMYFRHQSRWESLVSDEHRCATVAKWPLYMRKFTVGYQLTKIVELGLDALEHLDEKSDAINGYLQLLEQKLYVVHHRGHWYNRLSILMLKVDKNADAVARMLLRAVEDELLRDYQRFELQERLERVSKKVSANLHRDIAGGRKKLVVQVPVAVEIRGQLCAKDKNAGKSVFIREGQQENVVCSVEELALAHYLENGYSTGLHCEGSLVTSLYGILMWDVIYAEQLDDVFRCDLQAAPLDLHCPSFYTARRPLIAAKLDSLRSSDMTDILAAVEKWWECKSHFYSPAVNRELFPSSDYLTELISCFTPAQLVMLCQRLATDLGAVRAGFPDLTVWDEKRKTVKFVEVKGPNDRLSFKQRMWIDFLMTASGSLPCGCLWCQKKAFLSC